jgi:predicted transport protein
MSVDAVKQAEANQLKNIAEKSGKTIDEWAAIVKTSGLSKHGELVNMLKEKHGLGHGNAYALVHYANKSRSTFSDEDVLITEQYKGKEDIKAWYDELIKKVKGIGTEVELSPKKAYVSLRRKKQYAIIQPSTKTRIDIGLNIKNTEPTGKLEAAGSWNTMCSHRIKIEDAKDINTDVVNWIKQAYEQAG